MYSVIAARGIFGHVVILFSLIFLASCDEKDMSAMEKVSQYERRNLIISGSDKLITFIAATNAQQVQGLSGIKPEQFQDNFAMFFPGKKNQMRKFWMPDTYFDLDIFFLDENMKVVELQRNVPHHPGRSETPPIARTKEVFCRHVLEIKSSSKLASKIRFGQTLKWE